MTTLLSGNSGVIRPMVAFLILMTTLLAGFLAAVKRPGLSIYTLLSRAHLVINGGMTGEKTKPKTEAQAPPKKDDSQGQDVMLLHSPTEDGEGVRALRFRPGRLDLAELHPVRDGQAIGNSELLKLTPNEKAPYLCDVNVLYSPQKETNTRSTTHAGPARVSNSAYRQNWDLVFGTSRDNYKKQLLH